ncbi:MAG: SUMF1/EgtB/PvdO family nonheme iron enzyme [Desertifilum sp. SIO1I2]|nr:SUMF1/EgtB/PvdO family nonheme iron enzyme [Desertifilum sp. SIO1I2]
MLRGGSWNNNPDNCRSANRNNNSPDNDNNNIGFRVACGAARTLAHQNWQMGICRARQVRIQTCS